MRAALLVVESMAKAASTTRDRLQLGAERVVKEPLARPTSLKSNYYIRSSLWQTVQKLRDDGVANGTLLNQEKLHVTIIFLGNTPEDAIPVLLQELQKTVADKGPLTIAVNKMGGFRSFKKNIVWAGVDVVQGDLKGLHAAIQKVVAKLGLGKIEQRKFEPHVTLSRGATRWTANLDQDELRFGRMDVDGVEVFESKGGEYLTLGMARFGDASAAVLLDSDGGGKRPEKTAQLSEAADDVIVLSKTETAPAHRRRGNDRNLRAR